MGLFEIIGRRSRRFWLALLLALVTLAVGTALLGVSGWFLTSAALAGVGASFNIFAPSSLVRGLSFVRILSRYGERVTGHAATLSLLSDLRVWLFGRLIPVVPLRRGGLRTGDFVARLTADIEALDMVFLQALLPIATALLGGLGLALLYWLTLPEALVPGLVGFLATAILAPLVLVRQGRSSGAAVIARSADLRIVALDGIDGHADVVVLGAAGATVTAFESSAVALRDARLRQARVTAFGPALTQLGAGLTLAAILWIGLGAIEAGRVTGPIFVGVLLATLAAFEVTGPILRGAGRLGSASAAGERMRTVASLPPSVDEPREPARLPDSGVLSLERIGYGFEEERPILKELSLAVAPGERVAILGESGSGKSTLLGLITRLADVQQGSIRFAGIDVRDVSTSDLWSHVALLTQDAPVFIGTIRDNLKIGSPFADDATLFTALANARLDTFVRSLPQGLDTWLGESGATLSAGQARRLCLTRALLSPASILLLDEPTAGLDADMEADFLGDLIAATESRTLILATHASLPERSVDRIYRLEEGRLIQA